MSSSLSRLLGALFGFKHEEGAQSVAVGNFAASLAMGALAWFEVPLPIGWAAAVAGAAFVLLTLCLLSRYTLWLPALAGGATIAGAGALLLGSLAGKIHPAGLWVGGIAGAAAGFAIAIHSYAKIGRLVRRKPSGPERT